MKFDVEKFYVKPPIQKRRRKYFSKTKHILWIFQIFIYISIHLCIRFDLCVLLLTHRSGTYAFISFNVYMNLYAAISSQFIASFHLIIRISTFIYLSIITSFTMKELTKCHRPSMQCRKRVKRK